MAAKNSKLRQKLLPFLILPLLLGAATGIGYIFRYAGFPETNIVIVYILSTLITARFTPGYIFGIAASVSATFTFSFFFTEPYFTFSVYDGSYIITFVIMTITALITSALTSKAKKNELDAKEKHAKALELYKLANHLSEERLKSREETEKERLRANFLRTISHDLRTPLTSISGNAGMLIKNADSLSAEKKAELYSDIYDNALWLNGLVENLLSITRLENDDITLNMQPELLSDVIEEVLSRIGDKNAAGKIIIKNDDEFLMAKMDARLIVQVVVNLVNNAVKYAGNNAKITVSAARDPKNPDNVRIEVSDDGVGISGEEKPKIFGMYYTGDRIRNGKERGLGLGLYLCKSIVEAHDGEIYVRDNTPKGAVFGFILKAEETKTYE